jgi:hypothetical protein
MRCCILKAGGKDQEEGRDGDEMDEFEAYLFSEFNKAIINLHHSPFAVGLDIFCVDDDLRQPAVRLITNTYEHARAHSPDKRKKRRGDADSALEALWNNSYWQWRTEATVGNEYVSFEGDFRDAEGIELRKKWIQSSGLWYEDDFEESNFDEALEIGGKINERFDELCLKLAKQMHPVIAANLKAELPIIFFNRESPDHESMGLTFLANPPQLLVEYARFIRTYCGDEWGDFMERIVDKDKLTYSSLYK